MSASVLVNKVFFLKNYIYLSVILSRLICRIPRARMARVGGALPLSHAAAALRTRAHLARLDAQRRRPPFTCSGEF